MVHFLNEKRMHVKVSIASFINDIMELFMDKTITRDVRKRLNENGILKVFTSLTLTDTDSCILQFNAVCNENTSLNEDEFNDLSESIILKKLSYRIDTIF